MEKEILIVLGSPNSPEGKLSAISKSRLDYCARRYTKGKQVLCTGGWGAHFNKALEAHAFYAKEYLIGVGIFENDFLDFALSSNTVEDAVKIKEIIVELECSNLVIITSDYHLERVELIFREVLKSYKVEFVGVESNMTKQDLEVLVQHEKKAVQSILENGLYY